MPDAARSQAATVNSSRRGAARRAELEFLPAALEVLETPASSTARATAILVVVFFAAAIAWACIGRIDIIAVAPGKIVPTGRTKAVQPLEPGIIAALNVDDGDHVKAGQIVVELDATVATAERKRTAHDLVKAQLDVARLSALRKGGKPETLNFVPPTGVSEVDAAQAREAMIAQAIEQEQKLAALDRQIAQKRAELDQVVATVAKLNHSLPLLHEETDVREKAMNIKYGNVIAWLEAAEKLSDQEGELAVDQKQAPGLIAARESLERQVAQTEAEYMHHILGDLADAQQKAEEFTQDLVKADQKIEERHLRAPVDGTVQQLTIHTIGGVVTPAQQLMLIVPADSHLEIEAMVSNDDIGFVHPGQSTEIKVNTFNFTRYGLINGTVLSVSADAVVSDKGAGQATDGIEMQKATDSGSANSQQQSLVYAARVSLDRAKMQVEDKLVSLAAGMAVTVEIKTGSRPVIDYLLSPLARYKQESLRER